MKASARREQGKRRQDTRRAVGRGRHVTLRKREEQLLALEHGVTRALAEADSAAAGMTAVIRTICESQSWECGRYFGKDEKTDALVMKESWHVPDAKLDHFIDQSRGLTYAPGAGLIGDVWRSASPLWVTDIGKDERIQKGIARQIGMHGTFLFPVLSEGRAIGVLSFHSKTVREPEDRMLQAVVVIGSQIGQFLQRKHAEAVLRESEARFRSLTTLSSDWYWEQDAEHRFVDTTGEADHRSGLAPVGYIGKRRWELETLNMSGADWAAHRATLEARFPFQDLELNRYAEDGMLRWVSISGEPIFDADGRFTGYRGIGKDITARKRGEQLLALEHAVTRCLAETEDAAAAMKAVIRTVCETESWECGRYLRVDEAANLLRCVESWSGPDAAIERFLESKRDDAFAPGVALAGRVWQSGQPHWVVDIKDDPGALQAALTLDTGLRGAFHFPVVSEGRTLGVFAFNSRKIREPDERLLQSVRVIGSQIGLYLQRKRERIEAEQRLRDRALQQRLVAEFGQQAFASTDLGVVLSGAAALVAETLKSEFASVLALAPDGQSLLFQAAVGWPADWVGQRSIAVAPGSRLHYILSHGEALIIDDYRAQGTFSATPLLDQFGVRSGVQVPIFGSQKAFGVLSVHTRQVRSFSEDEMTLLRSTANILAIAIERKSALDRLAQLAEFDTVTGLPNRYLFRDRLDQTLTQAGRNAWLVGVVFIDLDRFKAVNDTYGHAVGDKLLGQTAARLKECVRSGDTVGRLSGDEFAVALSNLAQADDAGLVAQKIVRALAAPFELDDIQTYVTASIGIALYPQDGGDADGLLKNADTAMYRAKEQGRNNYQFYLPDMNERLMQRLQLETQLRGALEREEFLVHYQPKVSLKTGVITGFEALLRWRPGDLLVSPAEFIPILEETGLIVPVGEWVLRAVCEQIRRWQRSGLAVRPVAVNLSARQFQRRNLTEVVAQTLRETGVDPGLLELELTETLIMGDAEEAVQTLHQLKALGVGLSVDDFGTGYSSLAYLKRFPLDALKIDRAFIRDADTDPDDAAITLTIVSLAHNLKLKVVAEGVETEAQMQLLRGHGCDEMQGFYFARPLSADDCGRALAEDRRLEQVSAQSAAERPLVLVVDDNPTDLMLLERVLAPDGFRVLTAVGAKAALDTLAGNRVDIVISDHIMPDMTGVEFLQRVKQQYPATVRVIASGDDNRRTLVEAINSAGIHKFLNKNWEPSRLCAEVREAYTQRR